MSRRRSSTNGWCRGRWWGGECWRLMVQGVSLARQSLPLPRAGEGWGEGGKDGRRSQSPPHPRPLPQGAEGVKAKVICCARPYSAKRYQKSRSRCASAPRLALVRSLIHQGLQAGGVMHLHATRAHADQALLFQPFQLHVHALARAAEQAGQLVLRQ